MKSFKNTTVAILALPFLFNLSAVADEKEDREARKQKARELITQASQKRGYDPNLANEMIENKQGMVDLAVDSIDETYEKLPEEFKDDDVKTLKDSGKRIAEKCGKNIDGDPSTQAGLAKMGIGGVACGISNLEHSDIQSALNLARKHGGLDEELDKTDPFYPLKKFANDREFSVLGQKMKSESTQVGASLDYAETDDENGKSKTEWSLNLIEVKERTNRDPIFNGFHNGSASLSIGNGAAVRVNAEFGKNFFGNKVEGELSENLEIQAGLGGSAAAQVRILGERLINLEETQVSAAAFVYASLMKKLAESDCYLGARGSIGPAARINGDLKNNEADAHLKILGMYGCTDRYVSGEFSKLDDNSQWAATYEQNLTAFDFAKEKDLNWRVNFAVSDGDINGRHYGIGTAVGF